MQLPVIQKRQINQKEIIFLSGSFLEECIPKDKHWIYKYFVNNYNKTRKDLQVQFVRFYYLFGNTRRFTKYTGIICSNEILRLLRNKYDYLFNEYSLARTNNDFEKIADLESGKFKVINYGIVPDPINYRNKKQKQQSK